MQILTNVLSRAPAAAASTPTVSTDPATTAAPSETDSPEMASPVQVSADAIQIRPTVVVVLYNLPFTVGSIFVELSTSLVKRHYDKKQKNTFA